MVAVARVVTSIAEWLLQAAIEMQVSYIFVENLFLIAGWNPDFALLLPDSFHHEINCFLGCHTGLSDLIKFEVFCILVTSLDLSEKIRR